MARGNSTRRAASIASASTRTRCAVYTRKSSDEGLDQAFNSLDAQRESGEAYIVSQRSEGWVCLPDRYDDGGFSGGNMTRPALKRLLADIAAGRIDCVVVYKVDRLSRSIVDFARMHEIFEAHGVTFVSVTQQISTVHSHGKLMMNMLFSFAQFEREIVSERTRDKIAASRKKRQWTGGAPVLGYSPHPTTRIHLRVDFTCGCSSLKCLRKMVRALLKFSHAANRSPSAKQIVARLL